MKYEALEASQKRYRELLSKVSHELRTPLSALHGLTELLLGGKMPRPKELEILRVVHDETFRLTRMVSDLLDLGRLESGQAELRLGRVDLSAELQAAALRFSESGAIHAINVDDLQLPFVMAEAARLGQVFDIVLANAARFSPCRSTIAMGAEVFGEEVVIRIADHGLGIPATAIDAIFDKFYRVNTPAHQELNGSGLGLALAKEILRAHGGRIRVESTLGVGSIFHLTLCRYS